MRDNPFTPNFGQIPMIIAGRSQIISEIERSWNSTPGNPARTSIFVGARGTGKTALLTYFSERCREAGWISANVACIPGMLEDILQQTAYSAEELLPADSKKTLTSVQVGSVLGLSWEQENEVRPNWRMRLTKYLELLEEQGVGLLITVDEVSARLDEMIQLAAVYQLLVRENRKIALLMAGLPSEVSLLLNDRSVSFLRRASQYELGAIEDYEVEEAFRQTVEQAGKTIAPEALEMAVQKIDGFPYMLQLVGYRTWEMADDSADIILLKDVERGAPLAEKDFESRVLKATIRELSKGDIAFLKAMLADDKESEVMKIEKRLKKNSGYVSRYRKRLIEQGVIEATGRGRVQFALPGLRKYLEDV